MWGFAVARVTALIGLMACALPACAPDPDDVNDLGPEPPAITNAPDVFRTGDSVYVLALDNTFRREVTPAHVGDVVQFKNGGRNDHDVRSTSGVGWGVMASAFRPGEVYEYVFTEPGEYAYYCTIHGTVDNGMVGTILVTD